MFLSGIYNTVLDCLSVSMAEEIAQELSNLTQREVHTLAGALGFTEKEVEDKLATHPSTYDILLMLLLRFRQRNPVTARKSLAEALLKCEHYTMALRLHPKCMYYNNCHYRAARFVCMY